MSKILRTAWQRGLGVAIVGLLMGLAPAAFAVPPSQVFKSTVFVEFKGACCFSFNESVAVTEPTKPVPVVVTWSADYNNGFNALVGLMVNGGTCRLYGSGSMIRNGFGSPPDPLAFQWIVYPSDGLRAGLNTFTLCGGGGGGTPDPEFSDVALTANTLSVRLSK